MGRFLNTTDRFARFEYPGRDFPFYAGWPVALDGPQWLLVLAAIVLGFLALVAPLPFYAGTIGAFVPVLLFLVIPLSGLALVAGRHWTALFRTLGWRDVGWMLAFALLNMVVTPLAGLAVYALHGASPNAAAAGIGTLQTPDLLLFYLRSAPQILGEEVLTILPFLALLSLFAARTGLTRRAAIRWAGVLSALLFGVAHLPTYDWNLVQCFAVIGLGRLVLLLPYVKTKNLWVSAGAHLINDWVLFTVVVLGAAALPH